MQSHLLIFGFGYTAQFLAKKMRQINIRVTGTTRNSNAIGYNDQFHCELIHFSKASIPKRV